MAMTEAEKKAYSRGYQARVNQWPAHRPPHPPLEQIAGFYAAARALRDAADSICATLSDDDDFVRLLGPLIDRIDQESVRVSTFLRSREGGE